MHTLVSFAVALGTIAATVSGSPLQPRSVFCTPGIGLCALGIQTNSDGSIDTTVYDGSCNQIGGETFQAATGFSSLDSQLPYTVEIRTNDPQGLGTKFDYAGLGFGPGNGRNNWGCAACGDGGKSQCCGYYFVGPGCSASWDKATCDTAPIADAAQDQDVRWASVDTESAWTAAINAWKANSNGPLTFSRYITEQFFKGPQAMECGTTDPNNDCTTTLLCTDPNHPAGHLIINSFVIINNLMQDMYTGLQDSESDITTQNGAFSKTFSPTIDTQAEFKLILDIVGLGFAAALAPVWNSALKGFSYFTSEVGKNNLGTLKDTVNPIISQGITIAKDTSKSTLAPQDSIEKDMGQLVATYQQSLDGSKSNLFDGSDASIEQLHSMITGGKMLQPGPLPDALAIKTSVKKAIYAHLIPEAWRLSNTDVNPFIVDAKVPCGTVAPQSVVQYLSSPNDGNGNWACANGNLYYLFQVTGKAANCPSGKDRECTPNYFSKVPGADQIDGVTWGSLSKDDFVVGALAGYAANGNKNGWNIADPTNKDVLYSIMDNGVRAPGVINIPVCTADEAFLNWAEADVTKNANYPCNS